MTLPSLFLSHGAPDLILSDLPSAQFLRQLGASLPRPRAIVVASAHWTSLAVEVEDGERPATIHDFGGFAPELYHLHYAAPGDPALAAAIVAACARAGITARTGRRGFDHGVWAPLMMMYPQADIPVVAISVQPRLDGRHHLALGAALAPLRAGGVLVVGSGSATHNLGALIPDGDRAPPWVAIFDDWLVARAEAGDQTALADWPHQAPHARNNHPSPEHFLPFLVAMGAGGGAPGRVLHRSTTYGVLRMTAMAFGG